MFRCFTTLVSVALLVGCGKRVIRMEQAENPNGRYQQQITSAKAFLE